MSDLAPPVVSWTRAAMWAEQDARTAQRHRALAFLALLVFFAASAGISVAGYCWPMRFWFEPPARTLETTHRIENLGPYATDDEVVHQAALAGCVTLPE